jgi:hypothetical protein
MIIWEMVALIYVHLIKKIQHLFPRISYDRKNVFSNAYLQNLETCQVIAQGNARIHPNWEGGKF